MIHFANINNVDRMKGSAHTNVSITFCSSDYHIFSRLSQFFYEVPEEISTCFIDDDVRVACVENCLFLILPVCVSVDLQRSLVPFQLRVNKHF